MPVSRLLAQWDVHQWIDRIPIPEPYRPWVLWGGGALIALLVLRSIWRGVARQIRRLRPPTIHPHLQKYNIDHAELDRKRQQQALAIIATSTGNRLAGFRITRQVEAVFVEGYRTPEEAIIALKATAVERGANALLNVQTQRTAAGRCTASGDAVVADRIAVPARTTPPPAKPSVPPPPSPPPPHSSGL